MEIRSAAVIENFGFVPTEREDAYKGLRLAQKVLEGHPRGADWWAQLHRPYPPPHPRRTGVETMQNEVAPRNDHPASICEAVEYHLIEAYQREVAGE